MRWWIVLIVGAACGPRPAAEPSLSEAPNEPAPNKVALAEYDAEHVGVALPDDDVCDKNEDGTLQGEIQPGTYQGLLRNARCEQQKFLIMAYVAQALGVTCRHCHVPHPSDPKKEDYPVMTDNKRTANWMYETFIQGLRPVDGNTTMCASCHTDRDKPVAKILRDPRDADYAQEWMHEVMTVKFVEANGQRLRCKTCHVGTAPDTANWSKDVVRLLRYDGRLQRQ